MRIVTVKTWTLVGLYRLMLLGLADFFLHQMKMGPSTRELLHILIEYAVLSLGVLAWSTVLKPHRLLLQASIWFVDVIFAGLLLVRFSHSGTFMPAFLPLLAYEAELYWPTRGALMGGLSAGLLLGSTWWLRMWSHRALGTAVRSSFGASSWRALWLFLFRSLKGRSAILPQPTTAQGSIPTTCPHAKKI